MKNKTHFSQVIQLQLQQIVQSQTLVACSRSTFGYHLYLAILCDLFGMVKWPFKRLSDLQLRNQKITLNHLVTPFFGGYKQQKIWENLKIQIFTPLQKESKRNHTKTRGNWTNSSNYPNLPFAKIKTSAKFTIKKSTNSFKNYVGNVGNYIYQSHGWQGIFPTKNFQLLQLGKSLTEAPRISSGGLGGSAWRLKVRSGLDPVGFAQWRNQQKKQQRMNQPSMVGLIDMKNGKFYI